MAGSKEKKRNFERLVSNKLMIRQRGKDKPYF